MCALVAVPSGAGRMQLRRFARRPSGFGESCGRLLLEARKEPGASRSCLMETGRRAPLRHEGMGAALAAGGVRSAPAVVDGGPAARPTGPLSQLGPSCVSCTNWPHPPGVERWRAVGCR